MHVFLPCFRTLPAALIAPYYSGQTGGRTGMERHLWHREERIGKNRSQGQGA